MIWSIIGLVAVFFVFTLFLKRIGKTLPILELLLLLAGLQWIVGAFIEYRTDFSHYKYYMYVDETVYMSYVVPAFLVFSYFILVFNNRHRLEVIPVKAFRNISNYGLKILLFALIIDLITPFISVELGFFIYLLSSLKYVGAIILSYSKVRWHRYLLFVSLIYLLIESLNKGMFHDFLLWSIFFYLFWAHQKKPSQKLTLIIIVVGFLVSTGIQIVKSDYRSFVWSGYSGNKISLFLDILTTKLSGGFIDNSDERSSINVRLNQGWIISAIMYKVDKTKTLGNGETIITAIKSAMLPRFLFNDKAVSGGRYNFMKYTGLNINENTSMGLSLVGEFYANFGYLGGIISLGFWGLFLKIIWNIFLKTASKNLLIIVLLPIIFFQVVKAETELLTVLNHLIKSSIFVLILLVIYNLFNKESNLGNNLSARS